MRYFDVAQFYITAHPLMFIVLGLSVLAIGLMWVEARGLPFAQLFDGYKGTDRKTWERLSRTWSRPADFKTLMKPKGAL